MKTPAKNPRNFDDNRFHKLTVLVNKITVEKNFSFPQEQEASLNKKERLYIAYAVVIKHLIKEHLKRELNFERHIPSSFLRQLHERKHKY